MQSLRKLCLLAVVLLALAGCQAAPVVAAPEVNDTSADSASANAAPAESAPANAASANTVSANAVGLAGTNWVLSSLDGDLPLPGSSITLQFGADGSLSGNDGCNIFNTTFAQDGDSLTIAEAGATTMMACQADVMNQGTVFMTALAQTTTFSASARQLSLENGNEILATFVATSQELAGTSWEVTSFNNGREAVVSLIIGSEITADFGADARVSGNAGCNEYFAGFAASDGTIAVDPPGATFRFCDTPAGVMEQEAEYLAALESAVTYSIQGNMLQMRTADDQLALVMTRRQVVDLPPPQELPSTPWGRVTASRGLNVRSGPGANFPVLGVALNGDEGEIVGRSADGAWWVVSIPSAPDGIGWVSADFVIASHVENVPIFEAPAPPVIVPPTVIAPPSTPTPLPSATATPAAQIEFSADPTTIAQGQCATLRWTAHNVEVIWINPQNDMFDRTPRASQGTQQVCPAVTTTYEMRVQLRDGTFDLRSVTINVTASQEAQISFWADRTTIDQGQCTRLYWAVDNVQGVWVYPQGERYNRFPRVGHDSERICPNNTVTYEMRVLLRDNSTVFRHVTVNVNVVATPVPPTATPAADPLAGTRWEITSFNNGRGGVVTLLTDTHATVNFDRNGAVSGNASCNSFNTSYQVNGNNLSIGLAASSAMLCGDPEGIMDQENEILAALSSASTFTISGSTLEVRSGNGEIAMLLQRAP